MATCPRCSAVTSKEQRFCSDCGRDLRRDPSPGRDLLLGLAALAGVGLATVGLEALIDRLLGWSGKRSDRNQR